MLKPALHDVKRVERNHNYVLLLKAGAAFVCKIILK